MTKRSAYASTALSIAGSDSGGGAGIQADLAAFTYFGVFGATAITAVTAQNPTRVSAVQAVSAEVVRKQIEAVLSAFHVGAAKTGMLFSAELVETAADALSAHPELPLVVDPVMVATSGARLLQGDAIQALQERLLPMARVITPNLPEAEILLERPIEGDKAAQEAARELSARYNVAVLVKGGHSNSANATDILCEDGRLHALTTPRIQVQTTHGTGCSLSAAMAARMATGCSILEAAMDAKAYVLGRLRACCRVGSDTWVMQAPTTLPREQVECHDC